MDRYIGTNQFNQRSHEPFRLQIMQFKPTDRRVNLYL
jgi:hypothetical protein